ncbi:MurJ-like flippase [Stieleria bergensis]|uniref:MurJ-like flippase n=1 Tax=Stieleria bergensis TaxID=2528025 RepID=A0A517SSR4_9BACT|nr:MurJ-like flippase [Planctomycetes bacterium SV_7m_r]
MLVLSVGQAFVVGRLFGTSIGIEVYFAASTFYQSLVLLMQTGQVTEVVTPLFHRLVRDRGELVGARLFTVLMNWMVSLAACVSLVGFLFADWLIPLLVPGFDSSAQQLAIAMFRAIIPLTALQILQSLLTCYLTAKKRFVRQEVIRLASVATSLTLIVAGAYWLNAWSMVLGLWTGSIIMVCAMVYLAHQAGYRHSFVFWDSTISFRQLLRSLPSISSYVIVTQLYSIALTSGLSTLPQGSLAIFTYARRIFSRLNSLISRPVSVVFFNHYSAAVAKDSQRTLQLTREALRVFLVAACFMLLAWLAAGYPGLKFLWLSERFSVVHVWETYLVLMLLSFGTFFAGPGMIYRKMNVSHGQVIGQYNLLSFVQVACGLAAYFMIPAFGLLSAVVIVFLNPCLNAAMAALITFRRDSNHFAWYQRDDLLNCGLILVGIGVPAAGILMIIPDTEARWMNFVIASSIGVGAICMAFVVSVRLRMAEPLAVWRLIRNGIAGRFT